MAFYATLKPDHDKNLLKKVRAIVQQLSESKVAPKSLEINVAIEFPNQISPALGNTGLPGVYMPVAY